MADQRARLNCASLSTRLRCPCEKPGVHHSSATYSPPKPPDDALLGDEVGRLSEADRLWNLDPIDGTTFFSRHDPNWRVNVALEVAGETKVAVATATALGVQWWAIRGGGTFRATWPRTDHGGQLEVSTMEQADEAMAAALDDGSRRRLPLAATGAPASPLPLVELVRGQIDAFLVERFHVLDRTPWILLVEEAGGSFADISEGKSGHAGGGLYSNNALHNDLVARLGYGSSRHAMGQGV